MKPTVIRLFFILGLALIGQKEWLYGQIEEEPNIMAFVTIWGEYGSQQGQFNEPKAISVDPAGFLYIADTQNHRIQKIDPNGHFISEKGGFGWEQEQFDGPVSVSSKNGLDVFIADYNNHRIVRYDKDLNYLASFSSREDWYDNFQFGFPSGIDLSTHGELFCLDTENNRILKLDSQGNPQISFGDFDAGQGSLVDPQRLIVTQSGLVMVSDTEPGRIVVFDIHGNFIMVFGDEWLKKPMGMASTDTGILLVCDAQLKKVFVFDESGRPLGSSQKQIIHEARFEEPVDVAVWRKRIYILDKKRASILVFQWLNNDESVIE